MSIQAQHRLATRLSFLTALAVAGSLLLVGWTLYRPGPAPAAPAPAVFEH